MRIPFPINGLSEGLPATEQPLRTSFSLQNVRPYDVTDERVRGGQRPGTVLAYTTRVVGDNPIIALAQVTTTYIEPEA
jgi:hypothetical protein